MNERRNCYECYFFCNMSGTYEGKSYCKEGYDIKKGGDCKFINKKDKRKILIYKIEKRAEDMKSLVKKHTNYLNKLIIEVEKLRLMGKNIK